MPSTRLTVITGAAEPPAIRPDETRLHVREIKRLIRNGGIVRHLFRHSSATLMAADVNLVPHPAAASLLLRLLSHGPCAFIDEGGRTTKAGLFPAVAHAVRLLRRRSQRPRLMRSIVDRLHALETQPRPQSASWTDSGRVLYLYPELTLGQTTGGAVSHTMGLLNAFAKSGHPPMLCAAAPPPMLDPRIIVKRHVPSGPWDGYETMTLRFNEEWLIGIRRDVVSDAVSFVYQRNAVNAYAGLVLAHELRRPLVIEYNGSEVWAQRYWGTPLRNEAIATRIERLVLTSADLVLAVSDACRDDLLSKGVEGSRILVNPNGVDTDRYHPDIDAAPVRTKHELNNKVVVGFIGTFGAWHGAEILVEAFARLVRYESGPKHTKLLMIGEGERLQHAIDAASENGIEPYCVFTGRIPPDEAPGYLAACDILVAPHLPNPDGSPFFGSPTKIFEYMAMGRAIVASNLGQIGGVLVDGRSALLTTPGDVDSLAAALAKLTADAPLRHRLGEAARRDAVLHHTWDQHAQRMIDALKERCACD